MITNPKKVKLKKTVACKIAYIQYTGPYEKIPYDDYFDELYAWAKKKKVEAGMRPLTLYLDRPENTPPEECRSQLAIPIYGNPEPEGDIKIKELPEILAATLTHDGTTQSHIETYKMIKKWIRENGYEQSGATIELYRKDSKQKKGDMLHHTLIQIPIKKKQI
jgi:effector-binding domain-containing protein